MPKFRDKQKSPQPLHMSESGNFFAVVADEETQNAWQQVALKRDLSRFEVCCIIAGVKLFFLRKRQTLLLLL